MEVRTESQDATLTIAVSGSLNTNTAPELEEVVESAIPMDGSLETVIFDFSDLEYISSAGLRVLMVAYKTVMAQGGTIEVTGANDEVQEVLDITGFSDLFES